MIFPVLSDNKVSFRHLPEHQRIGDLAHQLANRTVHWYATICCPGRLAYDIINLLERDDFGLSLKMWMCRKLMGQSLVKQIFRRPLRVGAVGGWSVNPGCRD